MSCLPQPARDPVLASILQALFELRKEPPSTAEQIYFQMQKTGALGWLSYGDIVTALEQGSRQGLWARFCYDHTQFAYQFDRNALSRNPNNRNYANPAVILVPSGSAVTISGPVNLNISKGTLNGTGYLLSTSGDSCFAI